MVVFTFRETPANAWSRSPVGATREWAMQMAHSTLGTLPAASITGSSGAWPLGWKSGTTSALTLGALCSTGPSELVWRFDSWRSCTKVVRGKGSLSISKLTPRLITLIGFLDDEIESITAENDTANNDVCGCQPCTVPFLAGDAKLLPRGEHSPCQGQDHQGKVWRSQTR